jgi:hypothetical protein
MELAKNTVGFVLKARADSNEAGSAGDDDFHDVDF